MRRQRRLLPSQLVLLSGLSLFLSSSLADGPVTAASTATLTLHVLGAGSPPATGAVSVIGTGQLCNNGGSPDGNKTCTFQITVGTALRLTANSPTPSPPGVFSPGSGDAANCGTSTCAFTFTQDSEVTVTFDHNTPIYTMTINLAGDGPGEVGVDNSRCQNYDHNMAQLPTQFSACVSSYAQGSLATLGANPPAGSRSAGFSNGSNNAAGCTSAPCSFLLSADTSITATFSALTSIAVAPATDTVNVLQSRQFTAHGTYGDLTTAPLSSGLGTWRSRASMTHARFSLAAAVAGGHLYALGGNTNTGPVGFVEAYDPAANTWTTKEPMIARGGLAAGAIDGQVYAVGGSGAGACPVDTLERYDSTGDTWSTLAPMPGGPRRFLSAAVVDRTLYAIGGELNNCFETSGTVLNRVEAYDPDTNEWTDRASMPTARRFFDAGVVNGIIYAVGGDDTTNNLATVEAYNPATNMWSTKAPWPQSRSLLAVAVIDNVLYAMAGNSNGYSSSVFAYDPATDSWSMKSSIPALIDQNAEGMRLDIGGQRAELAAESIGGTLYAVGGLVSQDGTHVPYVTAFVDQLTWSTGDSSVATISNQIGTFGRATGRQEGTTTVRARAAGLTCEAPPGQCATLTVTNVVSNTVPSVTIFGSPQGAPTVTINTGQNLSTTGSSAGSFRDPDSGQTWTATVDYGDGSGTQTLSLGAGSPPFGPTGTFSLNHVYNTEGTFMVTVKVTDNLSATGTATLTVNVTDDTGGGDECAEVSVNIVAGNVPFSTVQMSVFDGTSGEELFTDQVPLGLTALGSAPAGSYRVTFAAPAGYIMVPAEIELDIVCGEDMVLETEVRILDTTPPVIASVTPSTASFWPPNHKMVPVSIAVSASDAVDAAPVCSIISVSSNEPVNGTGDGDTGPDWQFSANSLVAHLRAERAAGGTGRVYTIEVTCADASGNASTKTTAVTVPHDQRK